VQGTAGVGGHRTSGRVRSLGIGMEKDVAKRLLAQAGIQWCRAVSGAGTDASESVRGASLGAWLSRVRETGQCRSSVGVSKVKTVADWNQRCERFGVRQQVLVEAAVNAARSSARAR